MPGGPARGKFAIIGTEERDKKSSRPVSRTATAFCVRRRLIKKGNKEQEAGDGG